MKQVMITGGDAVLTDVPAPQVSRGCVRIAMDHSCISVGTEMSGLKATAKPLWRRAIEKPQLVRKVIEHARQEGIVAAQRLVLEKSSASFPCGYSGAGVVLEVGEGVTEFAPGDRVACAGSQCAYHAEVVVVPKNLVAPVPPNVGLDVASTVALGAIALQGIRRAAPTIGETFAVLGLGILGQITCQMLRANGCQVIALDLDRQRIDFALSRGATHGIHPDDGNDLQRVAQLTGGTGLDGVIITAASPSNAIVSTAFQMCRKKARVVLVGDVGLALEREDFYAKELDFLISSSYGPGRYDGNYEEGGLDYPLPYVRWTEGRNMAAYLKLLADGSIDIPPMISAVYPLQEAGAAYASLKPQSASKPMMVLLSYPGPVNDSTHVTLQPIRSPAVKGIVRLALIGAGSFAKGMHLPNLASLTEHFRLAAVVSRTGHNAKAVAQRHQADYCGTDPQQVLSDPNIDAVIVATRHDNHAKLALLGLQAGKHVLVEKPLSLDESGLIALEEFYASSAEVKPVLLTGFNRRFSPYAERICSLIKHRTNPMLINYRMNAGHIPLNHWVHTEEGGGRNRGEACHIYDLFTFLTGAKVRDISCAAITPKNGYCGVHDNFIATLSFEDGSVATLTYTALGHPDHPKEQMDLFVDGMVITLDDYRSLRVTGRPDLALSTRGQDKGQKSELLAFAAAVRGQGGWPIPLWQQLQATRIANTVEEQLNRI